MRDGGSERLVQPALNHRLWNADTARDPRPSTRSSGAVGIGDAAVPVRAAGRAGDVVHRIEPERDRQLAMMRGEDSPQTSARCCVRYSPRVQRQRVTHVVKRRAPASAHRRRLATLVAKGPVTSGVRKRPARPSWAPAAGEHMQSHAGCISTGLVAVKCSRAARRTPRSPHSLRALPGAWW